MEQAVIHTSELKREFKMGDQIVRALKGVDITIRQGEFVTIMGSSGSGKSTLLNILGCLDRASEGVYELDGAAVKELSRNQLARIRNAKIGFIFQSYNLLPKTTALENAELPLMYNSGISSKERKERAIAALTKVGLADRLDHTPSQLSGGQQQRVAIARSLVNQPVVLLADEATGNLDTRTSYEVMQLFQELNDNGMTIAFVTHEPDIARFSKRTIVLKDGHVIKDEPVLNRLNAKEELAKLPIAD
ncbi:MAG: ABC transporter ATP-binding protein [Lewinella sp.]|nr:ABC transporter ATP-binding protein [Lewinella sp.]